MTGSSQLISGAGGHDLYQSNENDPRLVWDEDDEFGALRLDLRPGVARFRFVALPGQHAAQGHRPLPPAAQKPASYWITGSSLPPKPGRRPSRAPA